MTYKLDVNQIDIHPLRPKAGIVEAGSSQKVNLLYCPLKTSLNAEESVFKVTVAFTELTKAQSRELKDFWDNSQAVD